MDGPEKHLVAEVFTPHAVVVDDGHIHRGTAEILAWLAGAASEFETTSTWLETRHVAEGTAVLQLLEGNFPGGAVELTYTFGEDSAGLISTLTISAE
ncbi:nuclear transport factor 2 family protein [Mycetocola tolaasinivorans]|uniref:Nuclear transport factor 2 family protein n=2 Tax=Mycetocola tolaasinivorans TaxID=76635 RepID=A0A3L7AEI2_9MICO|nr:nuclear transport factor 2 family protein [Mycetocola tolaasinivorans]